MMPVYRSFRIYEIMISKFTTSFRYFIDVGCVLSCYWIVIILLYFFFLKDLIHISIYSTKKILKRITWTLRVLGIIERPKEYNRINACVKVPGNNFVPPDNTKMTPPGTPKNIVAHASKRKLNYYVSKSPICKINIPQPTHFLEELPQEPCVHLSPEQSFFKKWKTWKSKLYSKEVIDMKPIFMDVTDKHSMSMKEWRKNTKKNKTNLEGDNQTLIVQEAISPDTNSCFKNIIHRLKTKWNVRYATSVSYKQF